MNTSPLKVAIIAGEVSGDLLGADLVAALRLQTTRQLELVGVGGDGLEAQGLKSLYDFSELSLMGFTQVIAKLPRLIALIGETAKAVIAARPDILVIIDSPDFTHRVASGSARRCPTCRSSNMFARASGPGKNIVPQRCSLTSITSWLSCRSSRKS